MILNHFFFAAIKVNFSFWECIFFSEGEGGGVKIGSICVSA